MASTRSQITGSKRSLVVSTRRGKKRSSRERLAVEMVNKVAAGTDPVAVTAVVAVASRDEATLLSTAGETEIAIVMMGTAPMVPDGGIGATEAHTTEALMTGVEITGVDHAKRSRQGDGIA